MDFLHIFYPFTLPSRELSHIPPDGKRCRWSPQPHLGWGYGTIPINNHRPIVWLIFINALMVQKSGDHQLRLVIYPMIYKVLYIPGVAGFLPSPILTYINIKVSIWTTRGRVTAFIPPKVVRTTTGPSRLTVQVLMQVLSYTPWSLIEFIGNLKINP